MRHAGFRQTLDPSAPPSGCTHDNPLTHSNPSPPQLSLHWEIFGVGEGVFVGTGVEVGVMVGIGEFVGIGVLVGTGVLVGVVDGVFVGAVVQRT